MWIKVVTTKVKVKGKRAKKVYRYVKVIEREYASGKYRKQEVVIATLGTLEHVRDSVGTLLEGLKQLPGP